jgi:hypothetical protein
MHHAVHGDQSGSSAMRDRTLIATGAIGAALATICCMTPLLVVVFGTVGLTAWLAKADYVLIPAPDPVSYAGCLRPLPQASAPWMTDGISDRSLGYQLPALRKNDDP